MTDKRFAELQAILLEEHYPECLAFSQLVDDSTPKNRKMIVTASTFTGTEIRNLMESGFSLCMFGNDDGFRIDLWVSDIREQ